MVMLRKRQAGASSHGHEWAEDGAVVEVPDDHAVELLGIPDGGFTAVTRGVADGAEFSEDTATVDEAPPDEAVPAETTDEAPRGRRRRRADDDQNTPVTE